MNSNKYDLEDLLKPQRLTKSVHDNLIVDIANSTTMSSNVHTLFMSAYYKISDCKKYYCEGDIDLLQLFFDSKNYSWDEVPFADSTLLLFEMKSRDTSSNYHKAKSQLVKSKTMLKRFTYYESIDCFYAFGGGSGFGWRFEQL